MLPANNAFAMCIKGFRKLRQRSSPNALSQKRCHTRRAGFLPNKRSTVWQLLSTTDDWEETLDNGDRVHACFLDMAKAFDKVNHDLLLQKLRSVGVYSLELKWFSSYLHGCSILTVVEGVKSSQSCISSGVPQGSISSRIAGPGELFSSDFQACARSPRWATRCSFGLLN